MARDAAERLRELIAAGEEIPYEVHEPGDGSPLCQYEPLTERFIRDHAGQLRELDSFGACCAAIEAAGLAAGYLQRPRDRRPARAAPARRARRSGLPLPAVDGQLRLLARRRALDWRSTRSRPAATSTTARSRSSSRCAACRCRSPGSTSRPPRSSAPTPSTCPPRPAPSDGLGVSPLGARRSSPRSAICRARARRPARPSTRASPRSRPSAGWSPPCACSRPAASASARTPGRGSAGDRWRRIATGAGRQRPGGYRLTEDELGELAAFSRALSSAGTPFARLADDRPGFAITLGRALNRFEAGLERNVVIEALNDYLLALRFVLEGGGPGRPRPGDARRGAVRRARAAAPRSRRSSTARSGSSASCGAASRPRVAGRRPPPRPRPRSRTWPARSSRTPPPATWAPTCARPPTRSCSPTGSPSATAPPSSAAGPPSGTSSRSSSSDPVEPDSRASSSSTRSSRCCCPSARTMTERRRRARARGGLGARRANLTRGRSRARGGACDRARARDLRRPRRGASPPTLARARPRAGPSPSRSPTGAGRGHEADGQRLVDDDGRPAAGEPGAAPDRADARRARGSQRPRRRALPAPRDHRVERARDRLRPQPARAPSTP